MNIKITFYHKMFIHKYDWYVIDPTKCRISNDFLEEINSTKKLFWTITSSEKTILPLSLFFLEKLFLTVSFKWSKSFQVSNKIRNIASNTLGMPQFYPETQVSNSNYSRSQYFTNFCLYVLIRRYAGLFDANASR